MTRNGTSRRRLWLLVWTVLALAGLAAALAGIIGVISQLHSLSEQATLARRAWIPWAVGGALLFSLASFGVRHLLNRPQRPEPPARP